ncbi:MAG: hypothetical protein ACLFP6_06285 [Spirochaetaceae bacterium]
MKYFSIIGISFFLMLVSGCVSQDAEWPESQQRLVQPVFSSFSDIEISDAYFDRIANDETSVVIRVPVSDNTLTESETGSGFIVNELEKELLRGGFRVRDRALLNQVNERGGALAFAEIADQVDTDFIFEITHYSYGHTVSTERYLEEGTIASLPNTAKPFEFIAGLIEIRVIDIEEGEILGYMTLSSADFAELPAGTYTLDVVYEPVYERSLIDRIQSSQGTITGYSEVWRSRTRKSFLPDETQTTGILVKSATAILTGERQAIP